MIEISVPGFKHLKLKQLVMDFNGTVAVDGHILPGVKDRLRSLAQSLKIHILTANTFGRVSQELVDLPCELSILAPDCQDEGKRDFVRRLGQNDTVCVGNGRNDRLMLQEAALGIAVILEEGLSREALLAADIVCPSIQSALDLLANPLRLVATLRA